MLRAIQNEFQTSKEKVLKTCRNADTFLTRNHVKIMWIAAVAYRIFLDLMYIFACSPQYAYQGMIVDTNFIRTVFSLAMYFLLFALMPKDEQDITSFLLNLQFCYTVAPMLTLYAYLGGSSRYMLMVTACILLEIAILRRSKKVTRKPIRILGVKNYVTVILFLMGIVCAAIPILYNGFAGLKAFDFDYIYEMRAEATYPPGFLYLRNWMTGAIVPFAFIYALHRKKYLCSLAFFAVQIFYYMECGNKEVLFILFPIAGVFFLAKIKHLLKLLYVTFASVCVLVLVAFLLDRLDRGLGVSLNGLIGIRALFIPAKIKLAYYDVFSVLPKVFFSDGMIGKMLGLTYPYADSLGRVVNAVINGELTLANANSGYLGEAYAQMGFAGMLLMSALLAWILKGVASFSRKKLFAPLVALFSVYMVNLNDSSLFITLLTGGMLVAFVLILIYFADLWEDDSCGIQRL